MWLLQPRQHKNGLLWSRLFFISCWLHILFLLMLFVAYHGSSVDYHIKIGASTHNPHATVIFVPLAKSIKPSKNVGRSVSSVAKRSTAPVTKKAATVVPAKPKKVVPVLKKEVVAPIKKVEKKAAPKAVEKKVVSKPAEKKDIKKAEVKKPEIATQEKKEKKVEEIVKKESKVEPKIEPNVEQIIESNLVPEQPISAQVSTEAEVVENDIVYIGQAERDALYMERLIRQEVESKWRPPVGLSKNLVCDIEIEVDWNGKANQIKIIKPSGVLVYDISVRSAIKSIDFPRIMCGKKICMNFKQ